MNTWRDKLEVFFSPHPCLSLKKNELLLHPYQQIERVCYIYRGSIRQYIVSKNGNELTLAIFETGSMLFYFELLAGENSNDRYYYQTLEKTQVFFAPFDQIQEFLGSNSSVLLEFLRFFSRNLMEFMSKIESIILGDSQEKIANLLLILLHHFGQKTDEGILIEIPFTHYQLSCMVGISRETLCMVMKRFEREKILIRHKKQIIVTNFGALEKKVLEA